ncbi:MAG: hypothetical protein IT258_07005 [Saprospiraceae bacterium]|nr:hypothetical protein [Saprospiraceae bacterium]
MKSLFTFSSMYPLLLAIFTSVISTSFQTKEVTFAGDDCALNVQKDARYGFTRKQVDGRAFPKEANLDHTSLLDKMVDGSLGVCVNATGICQWKFLTTNGKSKDLTLEIQGMEDIVRSLLRSNDKEAPDINRFLLDAKSKGATLQELGNGTVSVTQKHQSSQKTSITLVDVRHNVLLGSSVYRDGDGALLAKLVCMQMPGKKLNLSIYVFEHQIGEQTGWVTEIQCETSI